MQIWLGRHAEAESLEQAASDADRKLTETGRRQTAQLARWLAEREPLPDLILHSPLVRARETAEILHSEWGAKMALERDQQLAPGLDCGRLLSSLSARGAEGIVCIGHQPDIGRCLAEMLGGGGFSIPPGLLAAIEFPQVAMPGGGRLRWMVNPAWFA